MSIACLWAGFHDPIRMEANKMQFEEINPHIWKPEQSGDSIEGQYIKTEPKGIEGSAAYYLKTENGQVMLWGSAILNDRMSFVHPGDYIRITYKGEEKNKKGQDMKIYKLEKGLVSADVKERPVEEVLVA